MMKYELGMYGSELLSARYHVKQLIEHAQIMDKEQTLKFIQEIDSRLDILIELYEWYLEDMEDENELRIINECHEKDS